MHGPNNQNAGFFGKLGALINELPDHHRTLIAGDFNCQLGSVGLTSCEQKLIGKFVGHREFNSNGLQMRHFVNLHNYVVRSTQYNQSFKVTWTRGKQFSQIDHILTHSSSHLFLRRMQCTATKGMLTDHKALLFNIVENRRPTSISTTADPQRPVQARRKVSNPSVLRDDRVRKRYHEELQKHPSTPAAKDATDRWQKLKEKVLSSVEATLKSSRRTMPNRECRLALARMKKCMFWAKRSYHPKWGYRLSEAKEELKRLLKEADDKEMEDAVQDIRNQPVGHRLHMLHKLMKRFRSRQPRPALPKISLNDWVDDDSNGPSYIPDPLPVTSNDPLPEPPTVGEIRDILYRLKNNKTPGIDTMHAEFFKYSNDETVEELHRVMVDVWKENKIPDEWKQVITIPIPKVKSPKTIHEYRRICLSSVAYKVYSMWILHKLQEAVGAIGSHQAAFLPGRSTTDHLHVLQRTLQERWNEGTPLVLMSLDIAKAFDRVSMMALPAILRGKS